MTAAASSLHLLIRLGDDRFAIDAAVVVEVIPLVRLRALPGAPPGSAGVMIFRGDAVPVVDLSIIAMGVATPARLMTRIVIVRYEPESASEISNETTSLLGLLVPEVLEVTHLDASRFETLAMSGDAAPYLGPVLVTPDGVVQRVQVSALLSAELRRALYLRAAAA
jgi:chemotaxis-related protein WspB